MHWNGHILTLDIDCNDGRKPLVLLALLLYRTLGLIYNCFHEQGLAQHYARRGEIGFFHRSENRSIVCRRRSVLG